MRDFRELKVWQKAHQATLLVYRITADFPKQELYGETSQIRRCAASIGANIAEGCGKNTSADFARFLQIALGSASELQYHVLLCRDLGYISHAQHAELDANVSEIKKMLTGLIQRLAPPATKVC